MLNITDFKTEVLAPVAGAKFSWKLNSDKNGIFQKNYKITVTDSDGAVAFDTDTAESSQSVDVTLDYTFRTGSFYTAKLTVADNTGETAEACTSFNTEILPDEWTAEWIRPRKHILSWAPYIRHKFTLRKSVKRAVLYACGLGCAEYYINGKKISEDLLDPPFTNYEREVLYRAYDITQYLDRNNCFAALIGDGWYSQNQVWYPVGIHGPVCLCAEIRVELEDGSTTVIATDENWKYKYSPITSNNLYAGEVYDARLETPDFAEFDGDDDGWSCCIIDETPKGVLKPCRMPPVRVIETIDKAISVNTVSGCDDGAWILDLGKNFAGVAEFRLPPSPAGHQYTFRFAETLNPAGGLDFRSIGSFATQCIQQETYFARGDSDGETWKPRFTYHAFRYVEITGFHDLTKYGMIPCPDIVKGYVLSTDFDTIGHFECDNTDIMRLHKVMLNSFRTNYHGFPEDCPGREKCGWLGDAQIACNYGMMNFGLNTSYEKYVNDFRTCNEVYGVWQMVTPGRRGCLEASPLWGCAQVIIPYYMFRYYGNRKVITDNFDMMEKWVEHELARSEDLVISVGLGDWAPPGGNSHPRRMPLKHSSTMIFYEICEKMAELCCLFGYDRKEYYSDLAKKIKKSIIDKFYDKENHTYGYWGSNGVALAEGLYPDGDRDALVRSTVMMIRNEDFEMHTGMYANKYLVPILCEEGYGDDVLKFLFTTEHPSFRTMLDDGATTLFECIDRRLVQPSDTNADSYNHPMHSGFALFFYSCVAGIKPLSDGFRTFQIKPCEFSEINNVYASYDSPYGLIEVNIEKSGKGCKYQVTVPANTECDFYKYGSTTPVRLDSGKYTYIIQ